MFIFFSIIYKHPNCKPHLTCTVLLPHDQLPRSVTVFVPLAIAVPSVSETAANSTFPRERKLKSFLPAQIKSQASDSKRPKWKKGAPAQCRKVQPSCVGILSCTMPSRIWPFLLIHGQPSSSGLQQGC